MDQERIQGEQKKKVSAKPTLRFSRIISVILFCHNIGFTWIGRSKAGEDT